jgi:indole-3-glycerol phosphate synthase
VLDELFDQARKSSNARRESISAAELENKITALKQPQDAYQALAKTDHIKLIAEIKRRSPSKGFLAEIPNAAELGLLYQQSGAHAISVLTEESGFGGSLNDLTQVSAAVEIPTLRKDFISEEYQILEARAAGASFVLLILSWLSESDFARLQKFAESLGLGVLVETHALEEIAVANNYGCRLIGINTRDLVTFQTDIGLFESMSDALHSNAIRVAESSVKSIADVERYRNAGADVVLVGEALVTGNCQELIPQIISV